MVEILNWVSYLLEEDVVDGFGKYVVVYCSVGNGCFVFRLWLVSGFGGWCWSF